MRLDYTHTIKGEALGEARKQLLTTLIGAGDDPWQLDLDDLAAQAAVSKVREIADGLNLFYMSSDWYWTSHDEVEVYFLGFRSDADVMCLKQALT